MHTYIRLRSNPAAIGVPLNGVRTNQPARGSGCEQSRSDPIRRSWPRTSVLVYTRLASVASPGGSYEARAKADRLSHESLTQEWSCWNGSGP